MISLFNKAKVSPLNVVTLPSYCVPTSESNDLDAKREAKLQWMRDKGMTYLGDPLKQIEKRPQRRGNIASVRLVSVRKDVDTVAAEVVAREA
jgi:hypothetical protein